MWTALWTLSLAAGEVQVALKGSIEEGYYWLDLWVGSPPVARSLLLDTGSSLSGFPCSGCTLCGSHANLHFDPRQSSTSHVVTCASDAPTGPHPLSSDDAEVHCNHCENNTCHYRQDYKEGSVIAGVFVRDWVTLRPGDVPVALAFGCHEEETNLFHRQKADGILGLSMTRASVLSHTATLVDAMYSQGLAAAPEFALCLAESGGVLTLGGVGDNLTRGATLRARMYGETHYELRLVGMRVGDSPLLETPMPFASLLDSGTTFVYLCDPLHFSVRSFFHSHCEGRCGEEAAVEGEQHPCYVRSEETLEAFFSRFPVLEVWLDDIRVQWQPRNYLFAWPETPRYYCLGVYPSGGVENVLGSLFMRGLNIAFSRRNNTLSFAPSQCDVL